MTLLVAFGDKRHVCNSENKSVRNFSAMTATNCLAKLRVDRGAFLPGGWFSWARKMRCAERSLMGWNTRGVHTQFVLHGIVGKAYLQTSGSTSWLIARESFGSTWWKVIYLLCREMTCKSQIYFFNCWGNKFCVPLYNIFHVRKGSLCTTR